MSSNKDFDRDMAMRISRDAVFSSDLDYLDENAERLSKRKERTEEQKRKVSINGKNINKNKNKNLIIL